MYGPFVLGRGAVWEGQTFRKALTRMWLFYFYNMVKIQIFYLVFGAGSVVEAFY